MAKTLENPRRSLLPLSHRERFGQIAEVGATRDQVTCRTKPVERTLIGTGHFETVRQTRHTFQQIMRESFSEAVERILSRRVVAFMSEVHEDPPLSAEIFVLEREDSA